MGYGRKGEKGEGGRETKRNEAGEEAAATSSKERWGRGSTGWKGKEDPLASLEGGSGRGSSLKGTGQIITHPSSNKTTPTPTRPHLLIVPLPLGAIFFKPPQLGTECTCTLSLYHKRKPCHLVKIMPGNLKGKREISSLKFLFSD